MRAPGVKKGDLQAAAHPRSLRPPLCRRAQEHVDESVLPRK
jgi:hypothetical protein